MASEEKTTTNPEKGNITPVSGDGNDQLTKVAWINFFTARLQSRYALVGAVLVAIISGPFLWQTKTGQPESNQLTVLVNNSITKKVIKDAKVSLTVAACNHPCQNLQSSGVLNPH